MLKLRSKLHEVVWQFNNLAYTSALMFVWPGHFYFTKLDQRFLSLWARPQPELWTSPDPSLKQRILTFKKMDDFWQQFVQSFSKVNNLLSSPRFGSPRRDPFLVFRDPCLGRDPRFVNYWNGCPVLAQIVSSWKQDPKVRSANVLEPSRNDRPGGSADRSAWSQMTSSSSWWSATASLLRKSILRHRRIPETFRH